MRRKLAAAGLLLTGSLSIAMACGPDFPWQLLSDRKATLRNTPANSFAFEAARLVDASDSLQAIETEESRKSAADSASFANPEAEKLYREAVAGLGSQACPDAAQKFNDYLALPEAENSDHLLSANYNVARCLAQGDNEDAAAQAFQKVRTLALQGKPDPLGLAVSSYGEEAHLHFAAAMLLITDNQLQKDAIADYTREIAAAVELYAAQAARGSESGRSSLLAVAQHLVESQDRVDAVIGTPLVRKLLVAYAVRRTDLNNASVWLNYDKFRTPGARQQSALSMVAGAIATRDLHEVDGADRLAVLAYRTARFDLARELVARSHSALGAWVNAKLAIQDGDFNRAAKAYAQAIKLLDTSKDLEPDNEKRLYGEQAVVMLRRQDYVEAIKILWPFAANFWGDIAYVGERILTPNELKRFVDANTESIQPGFSDQEPTDSQKLRALLARRLMREGLFREALPYFDNVEIRHSASDYAKSIMLGKSGSSRLARAQALWQAATLARNKGMEIMGYEGPPDYAAMEGSYNEGYGEVTPGTDFVSANEQWRFDRSGDTYVEKRFHYRYIAADLAKAAAELTPPKSEAYAAALCWAAGWMLKTDGGVAIGQKLYKLYVEHGSFEPWAANFGNDCPEPDFATSFGKHV